MEPATWIAVGAMVASLVAVLLNLYKAYRERNQEYVTETAEFVKAKAESRLSTVEAAERIINLYGQTLEELQDKIIRLEAEIDRLREENVRLRLKQQEFEERDITPEDI